MPNRQSTAASTIGPGSKKSLVDIEGRRKRDVGGGIGME